MKCAGKIAFWLATGLVLGTGAWADDVVSADNPYTPIVTRNIFGLNPVAPSEPAGDPPPKITLNGIMSSFGKLQVLFKVANISRVGEQPKDLFYILSEGQRQDDIEVMHINDQAGMVTFNNHGTVQDIPLANAPTGGPTTGPGHGGPAGLRSSFGRPQGGLNGGNGPGNIPGRNATSRQNRGRGNDANQNPDPSIPGDAMTLQSLGSSARAAGYNPPDIQNPMTAEQNAAMIEIQRQAYLTDKNPMNQRMAGLLPHTQFTPSGGATDPANP